MEFVDDLGKNGVVSVNKRNIGIDIMITKCGNDSAAVLALAMQAA